jgi:hypothetical protein
VSGPTGFGGLAIPGVVDSTSLIRSAHTDARGSNTSMNVASSTAIRICMK